MRVLRVGVILCAILSCVDEVFVSMLILLPPTLLILMLVIRCGIDEGDSIDEGEKALHIDNRVMAINSNNIVIIIIIFCKRDVELIFAMTATDCLSSCNLYDI